MTFFLPTRWQAASAGRRKALVLDAQYVIPVSLRSQFTPRR